MLRKLKALVTGERQDLQSGELVDLPGRYEKPDPTPLAPAIGYKREPSLAEKIRQMVRSEKLRQELESTGAESFEDADDFDVGDDFEHLPMSGHENDFDPPVSELRRREQLEVEQARSKAKKKDKSADEADAGIDPAKPVDPKPAA